MRKGRIWACLTSLGVPQYRYIESCHQPDANANANADTDVPRCRYNCFQVRKTEISRDLWS